MQHVWSGGVTRFQGGAGILFLENAFSNQSEEGKRNVFWPEAVVNRERRGCSGTGTHCGVNSLRAKREKVPPARAKTSTALGKRTGRF